MEYDYLKRARELAGETVEMRRYLHENAEVGNEVPKTDAYIEKKLTEFGVQYKEIGKGGIAALIGPSTGKCILIRADIDALPMKEESGMPFASKGNACHSCGHDIHTAAALTCAKMLKENEENLRGQVKILFQPDEERILGAIDMIENGVLEDPHVDVCISMHTNMLMHPGEFNCLPGGYLSSSDSFRITVKGRGAHGSEPEFSVDPILVGSEIVNNVQEISSREVSGFKTFVLTFGVFKSGEAFNIIPATAQLEGTIRCFDRETRDFVKKRLTEIAKSTAAVYRAEAEVEFPASTPVTYNDPQLTDDILRYLRESFDPAIVHSMSLYQKPSDDFAYYGEHCPSVMYHVGMGNKEDGHEYPLHNPKVWFDESAFPNASAAFAIICSRWLEEHSA
jgi:amidohydrolase